MSFFPADQEPATDIFSPTVPSLSSNSAETRPGVLIAGATGYLGTLITSALLRDREDLIIALVREGSGRDTFEERLLRELAAAEGGNGKEEQLFTRVRLLPFPFDGGPDSLASVLEPLEIREIVHSAGCVDYYDTAELERVNIGFTRQLLAVARRFKVQRFTYVSTAYSSGCVDGIVTERLHGSATRDPNEYTRTKRIAEQCVADSGVPYLIVRPSVVIGDSQTGRYSGKRYGLYQFWMGVERLLYDRYHEEMHIVAPTTPVNFLHQDSFQRAFLRAFRTLPAGTIFNMTSAYETGTSVRDLWESWFDALVRPPRVRYYDSLSEAPLKRMHPRQRAFAMFASGNIEVTSHHWRFETAVLEQLKNQGLEFRDATLSSIRVCQQRFIESSARLQHFLGRFSHRRA